LPAAASSPAAPTPGDYAIHLESAGSESSVQSSWDQLRATYPAQIADKSLLVREVDLGDRGVFYRILAGPFADASAADTACRKLEGLGQYCAVYSFE
jgi:cell division septation protein DedD